MVNDLQFLWLSGFGAAFFCRALWSGVEHLVAPPRGYRGSLMTRFNEGAWEVLIGGLIITGFLWVGYLVQYR